TDLQGMPAQIDRAPHVTDGEVRLGEAVARLELKVVVPKGGADRGGPPAGLARSGVVTDVAQARAHVGDDVPQSPVVVKLAGQGLRLAEELEDLLIAPERSERRSQIESEIDGRRRRLARGRETPERVERLLETAHRLLVGRAHRRLRPGASGGRAGLAPPLAATGMVSEPIDIVGGKPLESRQDPRVQ